MKPASSSGIKLVLWWIFAYPAVSCIVSLALAGPVAAAEGASFGDAFLFLLMLNRPDGRCCRPFRLSLNRTHTRFSVSLLAFAKAFAVFTLIFFTVSGQRAALALLMAVFTAVIAIAVELLVATAFPA